MPSYDRPPPPAEPPPSPQPPATVAFPTLPDASTLGFSSAEAPAAEPEPAAGGQWSDGSEPPPPSRSRRSRGVAVGAPTYDEDAPDQQPRPRRLLAFLVLAVVLLGGAYLVKTQLLDDNSTSTTSAPSVRASAVPSGPPSLSATELAASLQDPHFKHGYDAGQARAKAGAVAAADREQVCRSMALTQRAGGYPWGAHDRAGCLIALARG